MPIEGVFPLSQRSTTSGRSRARSAGGRAPCRGVAAAHASSPRSPGFVLASFAVTSTTRRSRTAYDACVEDAFERLRGAGFEVVDVDVPELDLADETIGTIVVKEAYDVHRDLLEREGAGYGPGTRAVIEAGQDVDAERYESALADRQRITEGFARVFEGDGLLAGPTVAYPAPHEDPPVGTPEGDVEGRFTGPFNLAGLPGRVGSLRVRRGRPSRRPAAGGACRRRRARSLASPPSSRGSADEGRGLQLDADRALPGARRSHRPAARLGRAARLPVARSRRHPRRARRRRGRRAARRAGSSGARLRSDALLRRVSREPDSQRRRHTRP